MTAPFGLRLCFGALAAPFAAAAGAAAGGEAAAAAGEQRADAQGSVLMRALRDELARSMEALRMDDVEGPFFLAYRVDETETRGATAAFGGVTETTDSKARALTVELRVGEPALDNSNYLGSTISWFYPDLPLDDNYRELRRHLWLVTDEAYKNALETLTAKRAALQSKQRDETPDFVARPPVVAADEPFELHVRTDALADLTRRLSAVFRQTPGVHESHAEAEAGVARMHLVNSEGSSFVKVRPWARVAAVAKTQAPQGDVLEDAEDFYATTFDQLPDLPAMEARVRAMAKTLSARQGASSLQRYSGPVLFEGAAAAELFLQTFAPRLCALREPVGGDHGWRESVFRNPFGDRVGTRVLPRFLSVVDDPSLTARDPKRWLGGYAMDDDGVAAAPTKVIENGILKTLLTTRHPVPGLAGTTGNRRGALARPSNLVVSNNAPDRPDRPALRAMFLELVEAAGSGFGILVRRIVNEQKLRRSETWTGADEELRTGRLAEAYKVFPDGREELVRIVEPAPLAVADFKYVVAASRQAAHYTTLVRWSRLLRFTLVHGQAGGDVSWISIAAPDLLFEDLILRKPVGDVSRPPLAKHPFFEQDARQGTLRELAQRQQHLLGEIHRQRRAGLVHHPHNHPLLFANKVDHHNHVATPAPETF